MPYVRVASLTMPGPSAATAEIVPRGACPTARRPFVAADGLLVRVRVADCELPVAGLRALGAAAGRHGNGVVELTSRANVQLRGVRPEALDTLVADLVAAGLLPADEADEPRCDVVVPPTAGLGLSEPVDVRTIAADLRARLAELAAATPAERWSPKAASRVRRKSCIACNPTSRRASAPVLRRAGISRCWAIPPTATSIPRAAATSNSGLDPL